SRRHGRQGFQDDRPLVKPASLDRPACLVRGSRRIHARAMRSPSVGLLAPHRSRRVAPAAASTATDVSDADATVFGGGDGPPVRRATERLVRSMGFSVQTFASANEFTEHARVESPSCLVLDVHLPGLSGLDLQRKLADAGVQIPIIFITGRGSIPMSV